LTDSTTGPDEQHNARDARVQVLTAEVRTLMVGSRQVTMSVYNQLDEIHPSGVIPFGRVTPRGADTRLFIYVVGKKPDGELCRSHIPRPQALSEYGLVRVRIAPGTRREAQYRLWQQGGAGERDYLHEVAEDWTRLPLIVLAGLR
jgi:hypothetical protein